MTGLPRGRIAKYVKTWKERGYPDDIPDDVPDALLREQLAPSYRAICIALLKNDMQMHSLGFTPADSPVYAALKRIEIEARKAK